MIRAIFPILIGLTLWLAADRVVAGLVQCEAAQSCPQSGSDRL